MSKLANQNEESFAVKSANAGDDILGKIVSPVAVIDDQLLFRDGVFR